MFEIRSFCCSDKDVRIVKGSNGRNFASGDETAEGLGPDVKKMEVLKFRSRSRSNHTITFPRIIEN